MASSLIAACNRVRSTELRRHGQPQGQPGRTHSWCCRRQDPNLLLEQEDPNLPHLTYAHGMGAAIVRSLALSYAERLDGVLATNPVPAACFHTARSERLMAQIAILILPPFAGSQTGSSWAEP